jgi:hypothetical protein
MPTPLSVLPWNENYTILVTIPAILKPAEAAANGQIRRTGLYLLGISAYYHDSAAALVKDGEILSAAQEERFTRKKHDFNFPSNAVQYCLRSAGIRAGDLGYVAFYDKPSSSGLPFLLWMVWENGLQRALGSAMATGWRLIRRFTSPIPWGRCIRPLPKRAGAQP